MNLLEYVWLDGNKTQSARSKIKVLQEWDGSLDSIPKWNFDGSSTNQAPGNDSERLLLPVRHYKFRNKFIVLCEVFNPDGTSHESNTRAELRSFLNSHPEQGSWWGFEQEYFIVQDGNPIGFSKTPGPQGPYYCSVGGDKAIGRPLAEHHMLSCLAAGMEITGINAEVAPSQWEYQCFSKDPLKASDDLIVSRYILSSLAEERGLDIDISPKPVKGDWNGSGCHANFSTVKMRDEGTEAYFKNVLSRMELRHDIHIEGYGELNHERLTGLHETQDIKIFSWGVADRGASIRVPTDTFKGGWKGYLEDRRPASNCDPYTVVRLISEAIDIVDENF